MSRPNFENIDLWLFEYAEGNLTPEQIEQLKFFVFLHPELEIEMDAWEGAKVSPVKIAYPAAANLIKKPKYTSVSITAGVTAIIIALLFLVPVDMQVDDTGHASLTANSSKGIPFGSMENSSYENRIKRLEEQVEQLTIQNHDLQEKYNLIADNGTSQIEASLGKSRGSVPGPGEGSQIKSLRNSGLDDHSDKGQDILTAYSDMEEEYHVDNDIRASFFLPTKPATILSWEEITEDNHSRVSRANRHDYKRSLRSTLKSISRSIQRMMDNPIALKNSRDPQFGLPGMTVQDINFSTVGSLLTTRVQTLSRIQFLGTDQEQLMNTVNIDGYSYGIRGGIGVQLYHSTFHNGGIQNGGMALTYAPKFSVNRFLSIEPSVRFKMGAKVLDYNRVSGLDQVELEPGVTNTFYPDGTTPIGRQLWYKDMGLGFMVNTKWFFAGINADNLFHHQDNIYSSNWEEQQRSTVNFTATMGTDWENSKENMRLSPYAVLRVNNGKEKAFAGANFQWNWFTVGAAVSSEAEPIASIGMKFNHFVLSYTADYSKSNSLNKQLLSHQVSIRINGNTSRFGKRLTNL